MTESILVASGATDSSRANLPEYTVSELSAAVKLSLEQGFSYDQLSDLVLDGLA